MAYVSRGFGDESMPRYPVKRRPFWRRFRTPEKACFPGDILHFARAQKCIQKPLRNAGKLQKKTWNPYGIHAFCTRFVVVSECIFVPARIEVYPLGNTPFQECGIALKKVYVVRGSVAYFRVKGRVSYANTPCFAALSEHPFATLQTAVYAK